MIIICFTYNGHTYYYRGQVIEKDNNSAVATPETTDERDFATMFANAYLTNPIIRHLQADQTIESVWVENV